MGYRSSYGTGPQGDPSRSVMGPRKRNLQSVAQRHVNEMFLPGHTLPDSVTATESIEEALQGVSIVVSVMPSQHCRRLFEEMRRHLNPSMLIVSATKGLEETTLLRMSEVISKFFKPDPIPESARSAVLVRQRSCPRRSYRDHHRFPRPGIRRNRSAGVQRSSFRVYTNDDVVGVELGGAFKNIIAIAAGVCDGLGLGHNSIAALITRGLAEITRLVIACGGRQETMAGLAGLGDLVLTCTGGLSRNRSVGVELGRGRSLPRLSPVCMAWSQKEFSPLMRLSA